VCAAEVEFSLSLLRAQTIETAVSLQYADVVYVKDLEAQNLRRYNDGFEIKGAIVEFGWQNELQKRGLR
jgi:hypothetical protein